jgi:DNA repair exonuclease SbcCD nuclease subunit
LFKKAIVFTDLHFGLKSNSQLHNEDCLSFIKWATEMGKKNGCDTALFLGDWNNNRASINILTLNYSIKALEHLNANFDRVFFIPGNHDLYYRDKRDVQSVEWAKHLKNVTICNDWVNEGDVIIAPWLVGDDHKKISKLRGRYTFGHFELPHFLMNAMVAMPDHSEIKREHFSHFEHVFSGHFHKRQTSNNITYIGNCFPHNYADAGDDERGAMILEWGGQPEYHSWPDQPTYRVLTLSDLLNHTNEVLKPKMHVRVNIDIDISYEEANFIKETFIKSHDLREISILRNKNTDMDQYEMKGNVNFQTVDQIVTNQLNLITSEQYDSSLLLDLYRGL